MDTYRGFWVWGIGITAILGVFLIFVLAGWPGEANSCINPTGGQPDSCFCEEFDRAAILSNDVVSPASQHLVQFVCDSHFIFGRVLYLSRPRKWRRSQSHYLR